MSLQHTFLGILTPTLLLVVSLSQVPGQGPENVLPPPKPKPPDMEKGIQIENRGPIHEAFAQPGAETRGKGITAPKAPPPQIPEVPPDEKPSGANVAWIGGYWQWDAEKKDFLWVSGMWRNLPDGRTWEPGEWRKAGDHYEYIAGFWKRGDRPFGRTDLPEPPKSIENGPNVPPPHPNAFWMPGHWAFKDGQYLWTPGYWAEPEGNLMWQPPQYTYSGSGYRYVPGYWDYCLEDRGLLYAPVYFTSPLWLNAGWSYCPRFAINIGFGGGWAWGWGGFYNSLYIGPGYNCYYYGDYGWPWWGLGLGWGCGGWGWGWGVGFGYCPWWHCGHGFHNPCFHHYCWLNRHDANWAHNTRQNFGTPHTLAGHGAGNNLVGNAHTLSQLNNAANDHAFRGQTMDHVTHALKQANSSNIVQPSSQVHQAQELARNLPNPGHQTAFRNEDALRSSIHDSIRNAPIYTRDMNASPTSMNRTFRTEQPTFHTSDTMSRQMHSFDTGSMSRDGFSQSNAAMHNFSNSGVRGSPSSFSGSSFSGRSGGGFSGGGGGGGGGGGHGGGHK
jgi:hypothetical protein